jgi:hypothetical protein
LQKPAAFEAQAEFLFSRGNLRMNCLKAHRLRANLRANREPLSPTNRGEILQHAPANDARAMAG